ncbi:MAG: glycosyltransferase family 4 protein [Candidatus Helarchaeales archaeon]
MRRKLSILMITHKTESFVRDLARFVRRRGHDVYLYGPFPAKEDHQRLIDDGVKFLPMKFKGRLTSGETIKNEFLKVPRMEMVRFLISSIKDLILILSKTKFDILHAHWILPSGLIASLLSSLFRIPCVATAHGRSIYLNPEVGFTIPQNRYARMLLKLAFLKLDGIITCSKDARSQAIQRGASSRKIHLIYNGTDEELFTPDLSGATIREELGLGNAPIIIAVRKFYVRKGLQYLIKAMPMIIKEHPEARLILMGDGPLKEALILETERLNLTKNVLFTGMIPNARVPSYIAAANVCVVPSLDEGFGVAAVEAMSMKKPLVSTQAGGLKEVVNETNALIIPPKNSKALAEAILKLLENPEIGRKLGENGRKTVMSKFNWKLAAKKHELLYNKIINS